MNYIVRLTFETPADANMFVSGEYREYNVVNKRCVIYTFRSVGAAFMFLCLVTGKDNYIVDIACYTSIDGQKDFE